MYNYRLHNCRLASSANASTGHTFGSLSSTRVLPHASDCSVRRSSPSISRSSCRSRSRADEEEEELSLSADGAAAIPSAERISSSESGSLATCGSLKSRSTRHCSSETCSSLRPSAHYTSTSTRTRYNVE